MKERRDLESGFALSEDLYLFDHLKKIFMGQDSEVLHRIDAVITPQIADIVDVFYEEMLLNPNTAMFLDHQKVHKHLHASMSKWLSDLFKLKDIDGIKEFQQRQFQIGQVHARIDIPVILISQGLFIMRRELKNRLASAGMSLENLLRSLDIVHTLLDFSAVLMNESYFHDLIENERDAQSLMLNISTHNIPVECEKLRSILFDWSKKIIVAFYKRDHQKINNLLPIEKSEFGLWILFKSDLLFSDKPDTIKSLQHYMRELELIVQKATAAVMEDNEVLDPIIQQLDENVSSMAWLLSSFVEHSLEMESGRDPLTKLLNRRFIPSVLQKFIKINIKHKIPFAVLLLDIDHFKNINDSFGHDAGDSVLSQFSDILLKNLRSGDFVFRYGGEEFLIILSGSGKEGALKAADKIRQNVESHNFVVNKQEKIPVTTSVGVAFHEGHPDYSRLISDADAALYKAKNTGRNKTVMADKH